jgi:hypothetical protein
MARQYAEAVEKTEAASVRLDEGERHDAFGRVAEFFDEMTVEKVRSLAGSVYAPDAYFDDGLKVLWGVHEIEDYFVRSVGGARHVDFDFSDVAVSWSKPDHYVRWRMTLEKRWLNAGAPIHADGVTHFRFDERGRVILQRDFWNTGSAFYERVPILGWLIRRVRARI